MNVTEIVELLPVVDRVSRDVHYTYGLDTNDAYGVLALEVMEHSRDYLVLFRERQIGIIEYRLKRVAARYARTERVQKITESDQYHYDPEYVRLFLPFFYDRQDWTEGEQPEDAVSRWKTWEAVDTALDIQAAWLRLKAWQRIIISARHGVKPSPDGGPDWDAIAQVAGRKSAGAARTAYADATRQLCHEMNAAASHRAAEHTGPGARKAVSNARARHLISTNY